MSSLILRALRLTIYRHQTTVHSEREAAPTGMLEVRQFLNDYLIFMAVSFQVHNPSVSVINATLFT